MMKAIVLLFTVGALNACEMPPLPACDMATGEITCDMGMGPDGCPMGQYCMPFGSVCPEPMNYGPAVPEGPMIPAAKRTACVMPPPSVCDMTTGEIICDMGWTPEGCWMGDYCMPAGSVCPDPIPFEPTEFTGCGSPEPSVCDMTTGEIICDMGVDPEGCWMGDYCMPAGSVCPDPIVSETATVFPTTECYVPPPTVCDMDAGEIICDMGWGTDGCWMGDYCMPAGSICPEPVFPA